MSENDVVKIVCFIEKMMQTGDRYEVEIRGCSIWATEVSKKSPNSYEHNFPMYEKKIKFRSKLACFIFFFFLQLVAEKTRELIKKGLSLKDIVMNSILIDHYLWDFRRDHAEEMRDNIPFHRIRCIYY